MKGWSEQRPEWARQLAEKIVAEESSATRTADARLTFPFGLIIEGDPPTRPKSGDEYRKARRKTEWRRDQLLELIKARTPAQEILDWLTTDRLQHSVVDGLVVSQVQNIDDFAGALRYRPVGYAYSAS
ncbi:MAG TPA: hypothetical protein PLD59_14880 [Tepidisphaeraceae bacterium]|nr:hypothetical protein [Tepidisphaeraceae bacterium]